MSAMSCPTCSNYTTMFAHCTKCGIRICLGCYTKAGGKCPSCGAIHTLKAIR